MSKYYGTLIADNGEESTRCSHKWITAVAQSWNYSVKVVLGGKEGEEGTNVGITLMRGSATNDNGLIWYGTMPELIKMLIENGAYAPCGKLDSWRKNAE